MQKVIFELNIKLDVKLTDRDFDMVHRLGQFSKTANRPVICKFVSRFHKQEVMGVRKKLKGSAMVINGLCKDGGQYLNYSPPPWGVVVANDWCITGVYIEPLKNYMYTCTGTVCGNLSLF